MLTRNQVKFLQEKVCILGQALFFNMSESVLKLKVSVINALKVDDLGQVWFHVQRPSQNINEFDREFHARLDFYKKGTPFYLQVKGKAVIVTDPEDISKAVDILGNKYLSHEDKNLLLRMQVINIHYCPTESIPIARRNERLWSLSNPSTFLKSLQYVVKDVIPVFQSH